MANDKNIKDLPNKELKELYAMVQDEFEKMCDRIEQKSGYCTTGVYSLLSDPIIETFEIEMKIDMLEAPHEPDEIKVRQYMKYNPDNVLNKPILAYQHNSWYMIYDGVHRVEANRRLGKETVKATIIVPNDKKE